MSETAALPRAFVPVTADTGRYRQIINSTTEFAIVVTDRSAIVTEWNTGAELILGWAADAMIGQPIEAIFTPEDREHGQVRKEMAAALIEGRGIDERWHLKQDGTRFWASGELMPLLDDAGAHIGFIKVLRDRTAQKLADATLKASEHRYRTLYDAIDEGFCVLEVRFDEQGRPEDYRFLETNPAFERQTGLRDAAGKWMRDLAPGHEDHWFEIYGRVAKSGTAERFEQHAGALGDRWYEVYAFPVGEPGSAQVAVLFNDVSERRRASAAIEASERKWRSLFEDLQEGFILGRVIRDAQGRVTDWRYEEVNRTWGELVGIPSDQAMGRTIREVFPGIEDVWVNEFADVVETDATIRFTRQVGVIGRWYDGVCQSAGDDRFSVIFLDVTDRVMGERRREALAELGQAMSSLTDPDAISAAASRIIGEVLGAGRVGYGTVADNGETFTVLNDWTSEGYASLAGDFRLDDYGGYADDLRQGRPVVITDIRHDPRTREDTAPLESLGIGRLINVPVIEDGRMVALFYVNDGQPGAWSADELAFVADVAGRTRTAIERRRAEEMVRESEAFMRSVLAASTDCIKVLDLNGELTFMSEGGMKVMEISDFNAVRGCPWPDFMKDGGVGLAREGLEAAKEGRSFHFEAPADTYLGTPKFWSVSVSPILGADGRVERILSVSRDHSALEEAREQQRLLNGELNHRLKNVLAIVQSVANQTLRDAVTLEDAAAAFSSRLASLGRATDVLTATSWQAADLHAVLDAGLVAVEGKRDRIELEGPRILLTSQASLALTLALHELATNATKYGALSNDDGRVTLKWQVTGSKDDPCFSLLWQEHGGPPVSHPTRKGFGTRMIERSLRAYFRGTTTLSYPVAGVEFRIEAPLSGAGELAKA